MERDTREIYRTRDERQKMEGESYGMFGVREYPLFLVRVELVWHSAHSLEIPLEQQKKYHASSKLP